MDIAFSPEALADLSSIRTFIGTDDPTVGLEGVAEILRRADRLRDMPSIGRPGRVPGTRELILPPYILIYTVLANRMWVVRILHGAQDWP
ncbi:MAG: type II toxin-antitoxin system RelE/ParE family toxin [Alphaproteobacteria bacterium]|nr:type II toxin-antitoxin system RelE/ParE family toxin [Alphaproteobacteria bacterium]